MSQLILLFFLMSTSCFSKSAQHEVTPAAERLPSLAADTDEYDMMDEEEPIDLPSNLVPRSSSNYTHVTPGELKVFDWPVDESRLSRGYFLKDPRGRKKRPHLGIDLANRRGTAIYASHTGRVIYVGSGFRGYGRMIMIEGPSGDYATLYAHLAKAKVKQGLWVKQGDRIGDMGNTGRSTGTHLHFEIRTLQGAVDPLSFLPPIRPEAPLFGRTYTPPPEREPAENKAL